MLMEGHKDQFSVCQFHSRDTHPNRLSGRTCSRDQNTPLLREGGHITQEGTTAAQARHRSAGRAFLGALSSLGHLSPLPAAAGAPASLTSMWHRRLLLDSYSKVQLTLHRGRGGAPTICAVTNLGIALQSALRIHSFNHPQTT